MHGVTWTIEGNKTLLDNISLAARPGTLTAVIGPSGAGKSTFARLVAGYTHPTTGTVTFEGHNIHAEYASLRSRIGMVPQDDVVHGQLTVNQALMYAAELRLPPDTTKDDREQVVAQVLEELEMTQHVDTRVDKLSGGQRKRASVALELLTGPSLLILDEPTSGLDPALDRQVMTMLRQLADAGPRGAGGHALADLPRRVRPGAAAGARRQDRVLRAAQPDRPVDGHHQLGRHLQLRRRRPGRGQQAIPRPARPAAAAAAGAETRRPRQPTHTSLRQQFSTIARRQMRLIVSDRGYFIFLALLPFIMGVLSLSVPGDVGFGVPVPAIQGGEAPNEPGQILVLLNVGAIFMGTALTIRALIGERAIFLREQAVGLSTTAYMLAKVFVFAGVRVAAVGDRRRPSTYGARSGAREP